MKRCLEQRNRGPYPARNAGLRMATGEFVAFLDADDYWRKDCLERLHRALEENGGHIAYCGWQNVGERTGREFVPPRYEDGDPVAAFLTNPEIVPKAEAASARLTTVGRSPDTAIPPIVRLAWPPALAITE